MDEKMMQMSPTTLRDLAAQFVARAKQLEAEQPTYALALAAGVRDCSYGTVRWGTVADYRGEGVVTMADGRRWRCVGHGPTGSAEIIRKHGFIEMIPLDTFREVTP